MANQLELNVLYVNGNPLKVNQTASVLTSGILIYEINSIDGVNSAIQYYNNQSNLLAFELYYSDQTISLLLDAANQSGTSLAIVDVLSKNDTPFPQSVQFAFPVNGIKLTKIDNDTTQVEYKNDTYVCAISIEDLIANSNVASATIVTKGNTIYSLSPLSNGNPSTLNNIFIGDSAGLNTSIGTGQCTYIGTSAGENATSAYHSVFLGWFAGNVAEFAHGSVAIGFAAMQQATNANNSCFIGVEAGKSAENADFSVMIGQNAGKEANNAEYSVFIGPYAGNACDAGYVVAIGNYAGDGNTLANMFIVSNDNLPSYADRTAALAAINAGTGATAGSTYLYYNQTTFAIEGVRL